MRRFNLGTAVGFRITRGVLTNTPAILVFVSRKVHRQWLNPMQCLPSALEGPGGVWCDVDVVEFQYYGFPAATPKEQVYSELVDGLRGSNPCIGSGSQVACQETYGTYGILRVLCTYAWNLWDFFIPMPGTKKLQTPKNLLG